MVRINFSKRIQTKKYSTPVFKKNYPRVGTLFLYNGVGSDWTTQIPDEPTLY